MLGSSFIFLQNASNVTLIFDHLDLTLRLIQTTSILYTIFCLFFKHLVKTESNCDS